MKLRTVRIPVSSSMSRLSPNRECIARALVKALTKYDWTRRATVSQALSARWFVDNMHEIRQMYQQRVLE